MLGHGMPCPYNFEISGVFSVLSVFSVLNSLSQQRFGGIEKRLRFQDHPFAAAKRAVVHGAMAVVRVFTQVVHAHVHQMRFARPPHDSVIERTAKKIRKNSYDVELHGWHSVPPQKSAAIQLPQCIVTRNIVGLGLYLYSNSKPPSKRHQAFALSRLYSKQRD